MTAPEAVATYKFINSNNTIGTRNTSVKCMVGARSSINSITNITLLLLVIIIMDTANVPLELGNALLEIVEVRLCVSHTSRARSIGA